MKFSRSFSCMFLLTIVALLFLFPISAEEGEAPEPDENEMEAKLEIPVHEEETELLVTTPTFTLERDKDKETADGLLFYTDPQSGLVVITGYSGYLAELTVPASINGGAVTAVAEDAFAQNTILELLILPDSITSLGASFCEGCPKLRTVSLPADITAIPESAFRGCSKLEEITLPDQLISIGDMAFEDCARLGQLVIPASLDEIGYDAFMGCGRLIFDAGDNAVAIAYAEINGIPLGFTDTILFDVILILVLSAALGIIGTIGLHLYRANRTKTQKHDERGIN